MGWPEGKRCWPDEEGLPEGCRGVELSAFTHPSAKVKVWSGFPAWPKRKVGVRGLDVSDMLKDMLWNGYVLGETKETGSGRRGLPVAEAALFRLLKVGSSGRIRHPRRGIQSILCFALLHAPFPPAVPLPHQTMSKAVGQLLAVRSPHLGGWRLPFLPRLPPHYSQRQKRQGFGPSLASDG